MPNVRHGQRLDVSGLAVRSKGKRGTLPFDLGEHLTEAPALLEEVVLNVSVFDMFDHGGDLTILRYEDRFMFGRLQIFCEAVPHLSHRRNFHHFNFL